MSKASVASAIPGHLMHTKVFISLLTSNGILWDIFWIVFDVFVFIGVCSVGLRSFVKISDPFYHLISMHLFALKLKGTKYGMLCGFLKKQISTVSNKSTSDCLPAK